jgi:RNA polymerase sigma factor (sigma-70 family)
MHGKAVVPHRRRTEQDLVDAALTGDREAIEYLVLEHTPIQGIVGALAKELHHKDRADELHAAARLGIIEALRRFDPSRGVKFRTYAFHFIRGEMLKALYSRAQQRERAAGRKLRLLPFAPDFRDDDSVENPVESELFSRDDQYGLDASYQQVEIRSAEDMTRNFVDGLPANQRRLVKDVFWRGLSHAEAARARGISRPAATRTLQRVYAKGRHELPGPEHCLAA